MSLLHPFRNALLLDIVGLSGYGWRWCGRVEHVVLNGKYDLASTGARRCDACARCRRVMRKSRPLVSARWTGFGVDERHGAGRSNVDRVVNYGIIGWYLLI